MVMTESEPQHECCPHLFAQPWALAMNGRQVTVVPRICCHHGELSVLYNGVVELGHGPFATFEPGQAPKLTLATVGRG